MRDDRRHKVTFREATVADAFAVASVHVQSWRESFAGIVPQTFLDNMSIENRAAAFAAGFAFDSYKMFVAETREKGIIGFADFGKARGNRSRYKAELYAVYLLRDFQRQGIGGKLFALGVKYLVAQNMNSMSLTALEVSPYRRFYEKMGGRLVERKTTVIEGESYATVVYGWDNLDAS